MLPETMTGFFEDNYADATQDPLAAYMPLFIAMRAVKLFGDAEGCK